MRKRLLFESELRIDKAKLPCNNKLPSPLTRCQLCKEHNIKHIRISLIDNCHLVENWFDTLASLREIDDDTWNNVLKFPARLVKVIKDELASGSNDEEEVIDTKITKKPSTKPVKDAVMTDEEEVKQMPKKKSVVPSSGVLTPVEYLKLFYAEADNNSSVILKSLKTIITILSNLIQNPMEPKYRSLDKSKKPIQEKILNFQSLVEFLKCCGFEDKESELLLKGFPGEALNKALDSIYAELKENEEAFGVKVSSSFDPYAENIVSRAGKAVASESADSNTYDPAFVDKIIEEEKKFKKKLMERKVEDRELQVFNSLSNTSDFKKILQQYEEENLKDDNDYEEELRKLSALKLMGENAKNQKFGNKRLQEYKKLRNQKVYSTTILRIKFPDGLILQGKFGARERLDKVYEFVKENLYESERSFYLYKAPPKKILADQKEILKKLDLVPSGMIFFSWEGEDLATSSGSIALDMIKLKDKVKVF